MQDSGFLIHGYYIEKLYTDIPRAVVPLELPRITFCILLLLVIYLGQLPNLFGHNLARPVYRRVHGRGLLQNHLVVEGIDAVSVVLMECVSYRSSTQPTDRFDPASTKLYSISIY